MAFKIDLHTHSTASPDGGITKEQYEQLLLTGVLDCVAITDHNRIDFALDLQQRLGDRVIVGEEIMSSAGEIIGLYLTSVIPAGLTPLETVRQIKDQGGIVYVPHPFETVRKGLHPSVLEELTDYIELVEVCNGRAFMQNRTAQAVVWAKLNYKPGIASSDAHGIHGIGRTYTELHEMPTQTTLLELTKTSVIRTGSPTVRSLLYPKYHRLRRKLGRKN